MHICNMRAKIDIDKVKTLDDVKNIIESLQISFKADNVPGSIKHLVKEFDANVNIINL